MAAEHTAHNRYALYLFCNCSILSHGITLKFHRMHVVGGPVTDDIGHGEIKERSVHSLTANWEQKMVDVILLLASILFSRSLAPPFTGE